MEYPIYISTKEEREQFDLIVDKLENNGVQLKPQDFCSVGMLAAAIIDLRDARKDIAENGAHMEMESHRGTPIFKVNPYVEIAKQAEINIKHCTLALQMTPNARKEKITTSGSKKMDSVMAFVSNG